jgi:hypothetical protein
MEYVVTWVIELDGDEYDVLTTVGEPREAGRFKTSELSHEHVEYLLGQAKVGGES